MPHDAFADRVRRTIQRFELLPPGTRAIVALSGGPDSVALVAVLRELAPVCSFTLAGTAHLNHQLRGAASDADEAFCLTLAADWGLPSRTARVDVLALAQAEHRSLEDAARLARYRFLEDAANELGADRIAVGHTRDDQAETLILRLVRGAGPRGLAGIFPRAGRVVRPLIDVERHDILDYLKGAGLGYRLDETNTDVRYARNRIRHELLPILKEKGSGRIVEHLARAAEIFRADADLLDSLAAQAYQRVVQTTCPERRRGDGASLTISRTGLAAEPPALQRRLILMALEAVAPNRFNGFDQVEQVLTLANTTDPWAAVDLPGVRAERQPSGVVLRYRSPGRARRGAEERPVTFSYSLQVPGGVTIPEAGCDITAEAAPAADLPAGIQLRGRGEVAVIDGDGLAGALVVRSRRPGDRFQPLGLGGHKKLQDVFVDHKIAQPNRDRVPVVVDDRDRIVWVAGLALAEDFRVTARTRDVVILKLRPWSKTS
ncbi:MAG: tRNA lysidine(34) synthetase TilS [Acidobacteria bacterium]|nr:tRNA lysidine(34) synthetase TilS [Acidobacteriota bacterium]